MMALMSASRCVLIGGPLTVTLMSPHAQAHWLASCRVIRCHQSRSRAAVSIWLVELAQPRVRRAPARQCLGLRLE